jgi:dCTP deaminase
MSEGGILSGLSIKKAVESGAIVVDPWDPTHVNHEDRLNPASYDLTLGPQIAVYDSVVCGDFESSSMGVPGESLHPRGFVGKGKVLDSSKKNSVKTFNMDARGFLLQPGIGYLAHTVEKVHTEAFVPVLDGKSSIGRLFAFIHVTAGYGDPGFDGQYTLEVVVIHPLIVYPGMRFCQIRFHTLVGETVSYKQTGSYKGEYAQGPIPSQSWKMFRGKQDT